MLPPPGRASGYAAAVGHRVRPVGHLTAQPSGLLIGDRTGSGGAEREIQGGCGGKRHPDTHIPELKHVFRVDAEVLHFRLVGWERERVGEKGGIER